MASALAADDLNLSATTNELVLYDPSLTVTRGGGRESLQIGTGGADPLTYHSVETIDATTSGGEQFILAQVSATKRSGVCGFGRKSGPHRARHGVVSY